MHGLCNRCFLLPKIPVLSHRTVCTSDEWQKDVETLAAALQPGDSDEDGDGRGESKRLVEAAKKRVRAVYGLEGDFDPEDILDAKLPTAVRQVFSRGSEQTEHFAGAKEMLSHLRKLIHGENSLWPLVKEVDISGPYACLAGGLELVDLPGLNDPNEARVEVTREFYGPRPSSGSFSLWSEVSPKIFNAFSKKKSCFERSY